MAESLHRQVHQRGLAPAHDEPVAPHLPIQRHGTANSRRSASKARAAEAGNHDARGPFSEQRQVIPVPARGQVQHGADGRRSAHAALRHRHREPSLGTVMRGPHEASLDGGAAGPLHARAPRRGRAGQPSRHPPVQRPEILGAAQAHRVGPDQAIRSPASWNHWVPRASASSIRPAIPIMGGQDRLPESLIVEGDIAAYHRDLEGPAGLGDTSHRFLELPEDLRAAPASRS